MQQHQHHFEWSSEAAALIDESVKSIKQVNTKQGRFYQKEDGSLERYYSVTTVLGDDPKKKKAIQEWREKVGEEKANKVSSMATGRGTKIHDLLEKTIRNQSIDTILPHLLTMYKNAMPVLQESITKVYCLEQRLYSDKLLLAGTADGIVEWNGTPVVLDFKTANKFKKKEWILDYFMQCAAYGLMWKELTGQIIENLVVFIMVDGEEADGIQVFEEKIVDWIPFLLKSVHGFHTRRGRPPPEFFAKNVI